MNLLFYLFLIISIVGIDQYTKKLVVLFIDESQQINVIDNFLRFINVKNNGAGFSILQNQREILIIFPIIIIIVCLYFLYKNKDKSKLLICSFIFIIGGAIGNLIDRISNGFVIDFIDFNFGTYHYPSFNIADSFITVGAILLMIYLLFFEKKINEKNKDNNWTR